MKNSFTVSLAFFITLIASKMLNCLLNEAAVLLSSQRTASWSMLKVLLM